MKYYAGIGSRETPIHILDLMTKASASLEKQGYVLRSGGAPGADWAFQQGVKNQSMMEIYIPWEGYQGMLETPYTPYIYCKRVNKEMATEYTKLIWEKRGRNWNALKFPIKALMTRNTYQILGANPGITQQSQFVLCWCPVIDGIPQGGTAQAVIMAQHFNRPVLNMFNSDIVARIEAMIERNK